MLNRNDQYLYYIIYYIYIWHINILGEKREVAASSSSYVYTQGWSRHKRLIWRVSEDTMSGSHRSVDCVATWGRLKESRTCGEENSLLLPGWWVLPEFNNSPRLAHVRRSKVKLPALGSHWDSSHRLCGNCNAQLTTDMLRSSVWPNDMFRSSRLNDRCMRGQPFWIDRSCNGRPCRPTTAPLVIA